MLAAQYASETDRYDLTGYWSAYNLAVVEILRARADADTATRRAALATIPDPGRTDVHIYDLDAERLLVVAGKNNMGPLDDGQVALFIRTFGHWELSGALRIPARWALRNIWISGDDRELVLVSEYMHGTQVSALELRTVAIDGGWSEGRAFDFVDGVPNAHPEGILVVKHRALSERVLKGRPDVRRIGPVLPWTEQRATSLVELDTPRELYPVDRR